MMNDEDLKPGAPRLAPWTDELFAELKFSGQSTRSQRLTRMDWRTSLGRGGSNGKPLANLAVDVHSMGPFALRRTVQLITSDRTTRLELGRGLALGVGMPRWLRRAQAFVNDEAVGAFAISKEKVELLAADGLSVIGNWKFEGRLLGYVGLPDPVVYGEVRLGGRRLGELLAPRLHTFHEALARGSAPLWRGVAKELDEPDRRWMLALTALVCFCAESGDEWHDHQPHRVNEAPPPRPRK